MSNDSILQTKEQTDLWFSTERLIFDFKMSLWKSKMKADPRVGGQQVGLNSFLSALAHPRKRLKHTTKRQDNKKISEVGHRRARIQSKPELLSETSRMKPSWFKV